VKPLVCALGVLLALPLAAQTPPTPPPFTIATEVNVVSITAVVFDKAGHFVHGLKPSDVEVYEDGVKQDLSYFVEAKGGQEKIPLSVILVLDVSGSMKPRLSFLQEAAISFVHKLEGVDKAMVVSFNETVKGSVDFTGDVDRLDELVDGLQAWGGTSLYDAVSYSLDKIKDQPGRKAVIVFTDGEDTTSESKEGDVVAYAESVEATVYTVGFGHTSRGFLKKIAEDTGGQSFFPSKIGDLIKVFAGISEELHNHYVLAYSPKRPPDNSWRKIELKVDRKDVEVRVRKGYLAIKRRRG
jgi:Ca-activated chloride channel homolog